VEGEITSPTFALMNVYKIQDSKFKIQTLVHIDTYRLKNEQELLEIGAEDYIGQPNTITIIEWPEKIEDILISKPLKTITIEHQPKNTRKILYLTANNTKIQNNQSKTLAIAKKYLGKEIKIEIDRPLGTVHKGMVYTVNYGFLPGVKTPDGEDLDAYFLDATEPIKNAKGQCIAIVHRTEDDDDKLVISNKHYTKNELEKILFFSEKYFKHEIILL
jgi:inorganic pyrophosphatase